MRKANELAGLTYQGSGYLKYEDNSDPRISDLDVAKRVGRHLGKRVIHISSSPYLGRKIHVLQYTHLYNKDMERASKKLIEKFNN